VLGRHLDQPLAERLEVGAGAAPPPDERPAPAARREPPRHDQGLLALGTEPRHRCERGVGEQLGRQVELGFDVGLVGERPHHPGHGLGAGEKPDRLGEHRLSGPGLAGQHVHAGAELELGALDQREVVDGEPGQHQCENSSR
jgi:hypothetical protein